MYIVTSLISKYFTINRRAYASLFTNRPVFSFFVYLQSHIYCSLNYKNDLIWCYVYVPRARAPGSRCARDKQTINTTVYWLTNNSFLSFIRHHIQNGFLSLQIQQRLYVLEIHLSQIPNSIGLYYIKLLDIQNKLLVDIIPPVRLNMFTYLALERLVLVVHANALLLGLQEVLFCTV